MGRSLNARLVHYWPVAVSKMSNAALNLEKATRALHMSRQKMFLHRACPKRWRIPQVSCSGYGVVRGEDGVEALKQELFVAVHGVPMRGTAKWARHLQTQGYPVMWLGRPPRGYQDALFDSHVVRAGFAPRSGDPHRRVDIPHCRDAMFIGGAPPPPRLREAA